MNKKIILVTLISLFCTLTTFSEAGKKNELRVLFIGDSLTAGYGVSKSQAYPSVFEKLASKGLDRSIEVMNGSVSGSTSASGLGRLEWYVKSRPHWLILALGANDGLRGLKIQSTKKNLEKVILKAKEKNIRVVLTGMLMPKNYGEKYRDQFSSIYHELASQHDVLLIPFLLEGVALEKELNQPDGIHPNKKGHKVMAHNLWDFMRPHFKEKSDE